MAMGAIQAVLGAMQNPAVNFDNSQDTEEIDACGFDDVLDQSIQSRSRIFQNDRSKDTQEEKVAKPSSGVNVASTKKVKKTDKDSKTEETKSKKKTNVKVVENIWQQLQQITVDLKQMLMDHLKISKEDFDKALQSFGMTMNDLLDPNQLTNFFLKVNGVSDTSELLTNEVLAANLATLMSQFDQLVSFDEMGLTAEDVKLILEEMDSFNQEEMNFAIEDEQELPVSKEKISDDESDETFEVNEINPVSSEKVRSKEEESDPTDHNQSEKHQSEHDVKFVVNGSTEVTQQTKVEFYDQLAPTSQAREIVDQLVQEIKVTISPSKTSMEMVLTPETLGKINLHVFAKNGVMTAHLVTETESAKQAIESQLLTLKESLENQGLEVEAVEVTVAANNFDFMNESDMEEHEQQEHGRTKKTNARLRMGEEAIEDEKQAESVNMSASIGKGTHMDFSA